MLDIQSLLLLPLNRPNMVRFRADEGEKVLSLRVFPLSSSYKY